MPSKLGKELGLAQRASARFLAAYRKEPHPVALFVRRQRYDGSPLYTVYEKACHALGASFEARGTDVEDLFEAAIQLVPVGEEIHVKVLKGLTLPAEHAHLVLDPATMLVKDREV